MADNTGDSKSDRRENSTSNTCPIREITRVASSECPPSSKKLSPVPTFGAPSTSAQMSARSADIGMDLMQSSEPRVVSQIRCMTRAEAMLQPGEPFERTRAVDILGIPVKHYAGF